MTETFKVSVRETREITLEIQSEPDIESIKQAAIQAYIKNTNYQDNVITSPTKIVLHKSELNKKTIKGVKQEIGKSSTEINLDKFELASISMSLNQDVLF